jgi:imidazolonepropionase-like amidohydrolase
VGALRIVARSYVADVTLFDGATVKARQGVLLDGARIAWVGAHTRAPRAALDARTVDGGGRTLTPGLIDCHVHLNFDGTADFAGEAAALDQAVGAIKGTANLRRHLEAGVTTVRDLGGQGTCQLASAVEMGVVPGPRVLACGLALTITGGHGHNVGFAREIDGADDARRAVREQIKAGARAIKVVATGGVLTPGIPVSFTAMTSDELAAAVEEAHSWGRKVAAHAIGAEGVLRAVRAGVDSVEHCNQLTAEGAREMVARGTFRGPTLCAVRGLCDHLDAIPPYAGEKAMAVHDDSHRAMTRALRGGVRHVVSTDAGTPFNPHGGAGREVGFLVDWGMSPVQALIAATANGAENLGLADVGFVREGYVADLALWDENPADEPSALLRRPRAVYQAGRKVTPLRG